MRSTSQKRRSCVRSSAAMSRRASRSARSRAGSRNRACRPGPARRAGTTATIWGMLRNPAYAGQAAYGKTHATGAARPRRHATRASVGNAPHGSRASSVAPEEWKRIAGARARQRGAVRARPERLHRNGRLSPRNTAASVAAARDPRLPRVWIRLLPLLDPQQERDPARVLPLLGHRRPPPPRRTRLREPARPPRQSSTSSSGPGCSGCLTTRP